MGRQCAVAWKTFLDLIASSQFLTIIWNYKNTSRNQQGSSIIDCQEKFQLKSLDRYVFKRIILNQLCWMLVCRWYVQVKLTQVIPTVFHVKQIWKVLQRYSIYQNFR